MSVRTCSLSAVAALLAFSLFLVHDTTTQCRSRQPRSRPSNFQELASAGNFPKAQGIPIEDQRLQKIRSLTPRHDACDKSWNGLSDTHIDYLIMLSQIKE